MTRLPLTPSTIKKLFAYTGNQCAMTNCSELLVDPSGTMLGKIAHIHAAEEGGPRYLDTMTDDERRAEANLFIVCGKHHDIIDDKNNEADWPAEKLRALKKAHEARFKKAERQLIEQFVDSTQINQPVYPKTLRAYGKGLEEESIQRELKDITSLSTKSENYRSKNDSSRSNLRNAWSAMAPMSWTPILFFQPLISDRVNSRRW